MRYGKGNRLRTLGAVVVATLLLGLVLACSLFNQPPIARIFVETTSGTSPFKVTFDGSTSSDPDGEINFYEWDFGLGDPGVNVAEQRTFTTAQTSEIFNVTLTVTDDDGATDQATQTIEVFRAEATDDSDETTVIMAPTAYFSVDKLIGMEPLTVTFDASQSSAGSGTIAAYSWDFGDETTDTGETVFHVFESEVTAEFLVELIVLNSDGQVDTQLAQIVVIVPDDEAEAAELVADAVVSNRVVTYDSTRPMITPTLIEVTFDARGSYADAGRTIEYYAWNFGDGMLQVQSDDVELKHTYELMPATKTYMVQLTVYDDRGQQDTFIMNLTLTQD